ncbi:hypothetical protein [Vibrio campbellii]|jgi:hypothetical protein|uniref:Lipoprotein n=1 Tax=Vibrio campbellii TaxID=680 RepID=A0AAE9N3F5_9VIBR|nr:hypothetical protein [Vibrio campbellii]ARV75671.1 hypothetical protein A8140_23730 [Vibrio campbellii CAIM 519 = NBRC 15631 = ATCC 25920]AXB34730.1 hypothetical protein DSB67_25340 [Vibrio campbellii]ELU51271.1 hypothetical protein B878_13820 [Vibrio campbellii CAIM 519 = NBRC 15631 = ATCC 25920]RDX38747.1 hypothetical protein DZA51_00815 [Vibrio campbellii]RDX39120.1 hypothetical protein DZA52_01000 [Vibrio campbellii]
MKILFIFPLALLLLFGCGGEDQNQSSAPSYPTSDEEEIKFDDLTVEDGYDYNPVKSQSLVVDISSLSTERAHISVYTQFEETSQGNYKPDYQSQIISRALQSGMTELNFSVADSQLDFLAEIWFYDGRSPLQYHFTPEQGAWVIK